ncbi:tetratricopeptide repeat protein [Desulfoplanes sp.]
MVRLFCILLTIVCLCPPAWAEDLDGLVFTGSQLAFEGKIDEAAKIFSRVVARDPNNEFARNQLGLMYAKQEKFDAAAREFAGVVKQAPDNLFARTWVGVLLLHSGKVDAARKEFKAILTIDPSNANGYYFLGVMYAVDHDLARAVTYLRKAQSVGSDDPETHYRLAAAFAGMGMRANARLEYERALRISPRFIKAINGLGWLFYNGGKSDEAISMWKKVLGINGKDPEARYNLAKVYNDRAYAAYSAGKKDKARTWWKKTLVYEPSNKAAKYYLRKLG